MEGKMSIEQSLVAAALSTILFMLGVIWRWKVDPIKLGYWRWMSGCFFLILAERVWTIITKIP